MRSLRKRYSRAAAQVVSDHRLAKQLQQNPSDDENSLMSQNEADNSDDAITFGNDAADAADNDDDDAEDEGDPPFRKFGHQHIGKRVRYYFHPPSSSSCTFTALSSVSTTTTTKVYIDGTITGYLSPHDVDSTNAPAFICTRTHRPASLFHVEFDADNEYYRYKDLDEFDLTECCTWLSKIVGGKKRSSIASSDEDESEEDEEEEGPITMSNTKLLTLQNKPTATKQRAADTMTADNDEEAEFAFNGQLYRSYNEMVNAKRLRNLDHFTKLGLREAKAAVDAASSDTKCPVSNRGLKRAANTTQRYQQQPTERRKSSRLADDTANKKYIESDDDRIKFKSDDDEPEDDCIESDNDEPLIKKTKKKKKASTTTSIIKNVTMTNDNKKAANAFNYQGRKSYIEKEIRQQVEEFVLSDKKVELTDDANLMNEDEYKRLTEMMDTCITNPVDESVTTPYNVEGLLTDSELRPFVHGDTSYKACRERQAKKLVEENKMTPDLEQIFCVKKKSCVEGGSYDEEMETNECAEKEELYHNDDMVLPEGNTDDADESASEKLTKNEKKPTSRKGEKKDEEMPNYWNRYRICNYEGCQKRKISDGFCRFHFGQINLPITDSNYAFVNRLRKVLDDEQFTNIISWSADGTFIQIHDTDLFTTESSKFFGGMVTYKGFQDKMTYWGFKLTKQCQSEVKSASRVGVTLKGRNYANSSFLKNQPELFSHKPREKKRSK